MTNDQPDWVRPATDSNRVIVSAGIGPQHYRKLLRSTENHCAVHCQDTFRMFFDVLPTGCPPHQDKPYSFKIFAIERVMTAGFRYVLWMDSTFQPVSSIEPIWKHIEQHGFYVAKQGDSRLGEWCSDDALRLMRIGRDEAMTIPLVYSGLVGFDIASDAGQDIWREWKMSERAGVFAGPHFNQSGEFGLKWGAKCSDDPRCQGHRHDESALSWILARLKLEPVEADFAGLGFGRHVPDYDVVEMRKQILEDAAADEGQGYYQFAEALRNLCR